MLFQVKHDSKMEMPNSHVHTYVANHIFFIQHPSPTKYTLKLNKQMQYSSKALLNDNNMGVV